MKYRSGKGMADAPEILKAEIPGRPRRLIVNADDFGASRDINQAVARAHGEGILTTASLMVNGEAMEEAVSIARNHPRLGVGLHLTLIDGHSTLEPERIAPLVDRQGAFGRSAVWAGLRYFFCPSLREPLRKEIGAQLAKFKETGLALDHLNGHLNLHLHPSIFKLLIESEWPLPLRRVRLTRDRFWLNARLASGKWFYRISHALVFQALSAAARPRLQLRGWRYTDNVFGLLQTARVDTVYTERLLARLPGGDSELYCHPSTSHARHELEALVSPRVRESVRAQRIQLIRYQDL